MDITSAGMENGEPTHPKLRKRLRKALKAGAQPRHVTATSVTVWYPPQKLGCLWWMVLIILIIFTLGAALLFAFVTKLLRQGQAVTWELKRSGRIKTTKRKSRG